MRIMQVAALLRPVMEKRRVAEPYLHLLYKTEGNNGDKTKKESIGGSKQTAYLLKDYQTTYSKPRKNV
jgi:hypothetical protein